MLSIRYLRSACGVAMLTAFGLLVSGCGEDRPANRRPANKQILVELLAKLSVPRDRLDPSELDASEDSNDLACRIAGYWYDIERDRRIELDSGWVAILDYTDGAASERQAPAEGVALCDCTFVLGVTGQYAKTVECVVYVFPPR